MLSSPAIEKGRSAELTAYSVISNSTKRDGQWQSRIRRVIRVDCLPLADVLGAQWMQNPNMGDGGSLPRGDASGDALSYPQLFGCAQLLGGKRDASNTHVKCYRTFQIEVIPAEQFLGTSPLSVGGNDYGNFPVFGRAVADEIVDLDESPDDWLVVAHNLKGHRASGQGLHGVRKQHSHLKRQGAV